jgi:FkbM family methyltransferase
MRKREEQAIHRQRLQGGCNIDLDLGDPPQAVAFVTRRYEPDIVALITRLVPRGGTFFDVGANIGLITLSVAVRRPDVSIHAFEPDSENAARWRSNHELNVAPRAVLHPSALGASNGTVAVFPGNESGWTYVASAEDESVPRAPMTTLDTFAEQHGINEIDVLKLDVEGYEPFVLEGARRILRQARIDFIICEMNDPLLARSGHRRTDIVSFLAQYGYKPRVVPRTGARRLRNQATLETAGDLLFISDRVGSAELTGRRGDSLGADRGYSVRSVPSNAN